jgi:N-acetylmuramoyl-L-alanine amidase
MASRLFVLFFLIISFLSGANYLFDAVADDKSLTLEFQKPVNKISISSLKKGDSIEYLVDFKGARLKSKAIASTLTYSSPIKKIDLIQYKKDTLRVIIISTIAYSAKVYKKSKSIYEITLPHQSKPFTNLKTKINNLFSSIKRSDDSQSSIYKTSFSKKRPLIIIDPGHGGKDAGAVSPDNRRYLEKNAVLSIALKLKKHLQRLGFNVLMTRSRDKFVKLPARTHFANVKKGDLFVSIHANAIRGSRRKRSRIRGIETYYLSKAKSKRAKMVAAKENIAEFKKQYKESMNIFLNTITNSKMILSRKLAIDVQNNSIKSLRRYYRGVVNGGAKPAPFWVLVGADMPAILIETGYISNPMERRRLFNSRYQDRLARGIARGIARFFKNREREME